MISILNARRRYPRFLDPWYDRLDFYRGRDAWCAATDGVPVEVVQLFSLHWLHLEVFNGGFWQFFFNSTGVIAPEARDGFAAIGMPDVADTIGRAMARLGDPYPFDRAARMAVVGSPRDRMTFEPEETQFIDLADTPKVFRRLPRFVPFAEAYADKAAARLQADERQ